MPGQARSFAMSFRGKMEREEAQAKLREYRARALHYLRNAGEELQAGHSEKAGEALWGALSQGIKAVALSKGVLLRDHRSLVRFGRALARDLQDITLDKALAIGQQIHANFYEGFSDLEQIREDYLVIEEALRRLLTLMEGTGQKKGNGDGQTH
ncbi:hypothetical protein HRbin23_01654 [bacterium HR23]|nr:hypothetical protein HRbin23_01654 [bacterium HR23]